MRSKDWSAKKSTESDERRMTSDKADASNGLGASATLVPVKVYVEPLVLGTIGEFMKKCVRTGWY